MTPIVIRRTVTAEWGKTKKLSRTRHVNNWENADSEGGFIFKGKKWIYFYISQVLGINLYSYSFIRGGSSYNHSIWYVKSCHYYLKTIQKTIIWNPFQSLLHEDVKNGAYNSEPPCTEHHTGKKKNFSNLFTEDKVSFSGRNWEASSFLQRDSRSSFLLTLIARKLSSLNVRTSIATLHPLINASSGHDTKFHSLLVHCVYLLGSCTVHLWLGEGKREDIKR